MRRVVALQKLLIQGFWTLGRWASITKVTTRMRDAVTLCFVRIARPGECRPCPRCYRTVLILASAPTSFFGLGELPTADIVATRPLRCLALPGGALEAFLKAHPKVMYRVLQEEARKVRTTTRWLS